MLKPPIASYLYGFVPTTSPTLFKFASFINFAQLIFEGKVRILREEANPYSIVSLHEVARGLGVQLNPPRS